MKREKFTAATYFLAFYLIFSLLMPGVLFPANNLLAQTVQNKNQTETESSRNTAYFEENRGQFDKRVKFLTRGAGYDLFLTGTQAVYVLTTREMQIENRESQVKDLKNPKSEIRNPKSATAVFMSLAGANESSRAVGLNEMIHKTNYLKGLEAEWKTDIPNFRQVRFENVYQGIDAVWYGRENGAVQYDFEVAPNVDAGQIAWNIEGAESVELDTEGNLLIKTADGTIKQNKPFSYQEADGIKQEIHSEFIIEGNRIRFNLGDYDRSKPLTIDPTVNLSNLAYSTFLGGGDQDEGNAIAADSAGNVYVTGFTRANDFPTTPGTVDQTHNGERDVFITKLNPSGNALLYSTYFGGAGDDIGTDIKIDSSGSAIIVGYTTSSDMPVYSGNYDTTHNGNADAFVTRLFPGGNGISLSTYVGGTGNDYASSVSIAGGLFGDGSIYVTGRTESSTFPTTTGAYDTTYNNNGDVIVFRLNSSGTSLIYSTFLGGNFQEVGLGITNDLSGNAYIAGITSSGNFPTTLGAYMTSYQEGFVTKLNSSGSSLVYSTFFGGNGYDRPVKVMVNLSGEAIVAGETGSSDLPTTAGAFDTTHNGNNDLFVTRFTANGGGLVYSTYIGGGNSDDFYDMTIDAIGSVYLTGYTMSSNYPTTPMAFDTTHNGSRDVLVTKLKPDGSALEYSTFFGGFGDDYGFAIAVNSQRTVFITGTTFGNGFPTTNGAFDTTYNGNKDAFVAKFGTIPVMDFDGDGKTDISIFRPAQGEWWLLRSSNGSNFATQFGAATDKLVPGDYTGDGKDDIAFFRPSTGTWFVLRSEDLSFFSFPFGANGDIPAPADYDGDGKTDPAIFRPSTATWFILRSSDNGTTIFNFGVNGDKPVVADYDGDGKADAAIFRPAQGEWWIRRSSNNSVFALQFGLSTDKPVPGDYTGDGKADVAFWRPSTGFWYILRSEDSSFYAFPFGANGDMPVPGDYDGDGDLDAGVFRPSNSTWYINRTQAGMLITGFGITGDQPVPNAFVP